MDFKSRRRSQASSSSRYRILISMFLGISPFVTAKQNQQFLFICNNTDETSLISVLFNLQAALSATDMALALNRYLCTAVLPLLTRCAPLFAGTEHHASLIDSLLHTVYRLSKGCSLTKAQRDSIEECLLSICG